MYQHLLLYWANKKFLSITEQIKFRNILLLNHLLQL